MARPRKLLPTDGATVIPLSDIDDKEPSNSNRILAKFVQLGVGTHLLASKDSLTAARGNELEITPLGVMAISGKNGRKILLPWSNVRAVELYPDKKI